MDRSKLVNLQTHYGAVPGMVGHAGFRPLRSHVKHVALTRNNEVLAVEWRWGGERTPTCPCQEWLACESQRAVVIPTPFCKLESCCRTAKPPTESVESMHDEPRAVAVATGKCVDSQ